MSSAALKMEHASQIRLAKLDDAVDILTIYNTSIKTGLSTGHTKPIGQQEVLDWLTYMLPERPFWVYELDGRVVAWANADDFHGLPVFAKSVEIGVYVLPEFQRQGIARALLQELETALTSYGITHLMALIFQGNNASLKLFKDCGFSRWGLLPQLAEQGDSRADIHLLGKII